MRRGQKGIRMRAKDDFTIVASHDAFRGPYSIFQDFRMAVVAAYKLKYGMDYFLPDGHPGLSAFLAQNGSEKWIEPELCARIADEFAALLPHLEAASVSAEAGARPHARLARAFVAGCKKAAEANEPLTFEDDQVDAFAPWHRR